KWERGLSSPDIALLIPLAEQLDVTVTELLLCRRCPPVQPLPASDVEEAVQTAIHYAAHPKISRAWQSRKGTGWLWYVAALAAGGLLLYLKWRASGLEDQRSEERRVGKERRYRWGRGEERRTKNRRAMRDSEART